MYTQVTEAIGAVMSGKLLCSGDCQGVMNKLVVAANEAGILAIEQNFGDSAPNGGDALASADFDDEGSKVEEFMPKCVCGMNYGGIFANARTSGVALVKKVVEKLESNQELIDADLLSVAVKPFLKALLSKGSGLMSGIGLCSGDCRAMTSWLIKMELSIWTSLPLDGGLGAGLLAMAGGARGLAAGAVGLRDRRHLRAADGTEYRLLPGRRLAPTVYKDTIYAIGDSSVTCMCDYFDVDKALDGLDMLDDEFFSSRRQLNHDQGSGSQGSGSNYRRWSYSYGDDGIDISVLFTEQNLKVAKAALTFLLSQDGLCAGAGDGCLMMQTSIAKLTGQLEANHVEGGVLKSTGILLATPNPSMESMLVTAPPCWCSPAFDVSSLIDAITTRVNKAPQRIPSISGISSISDEVPSILTEAMSVSGMCQTDHCKVMTNAVFDFFSGIMPSSSAACTPENAGKCMAGATASDCPNPPMQQSWMGQEAISMAQSMGLSALELNRDAGLPGSIWPHVFWPVCFARQYCAPVGQSEYAIASSMSVSAADVDTPAEEAALVQAFVNLINRQAGADVASTATVTLDQGGGGTITFRVQTTSELVRTLVGEVASRNRSVLSNDLGVTVLEKLSAPAVEAVVWPPPPAPPALPAPPPPPTPPTPVSNGTQAPPTASSPPPKAKGSATVVLTLTASGSVSDFSDTSSLQQKIATAAGVDKSLVTIRVAAASVIITATIAVPAGTTAVAVQGTLSSSLGTAAAASELLGITVESAPTTVATEAPQESSEESSDSGNVGVIVGAAAGGLAFVLLMIVIAVCAVKKMKKASTPSKSP